MEVLFITHKYPPSIGGMEKQSYNLIKGMSLRCKVHTIIFDSEKESRIGFFYRLRKRVANVINSHPDIELIHLNDGLMAAFSTWLIYKYDIPVVATFHGLDVVFPLKFYQTKIMKKFARLGGCIAVSQATKQALIDRNIPSHIVYKIKNGVDHDLADFKMKSYFLKKMEIRLDTKLEGKKILVTMGRPVKRKGLTWFIKNVMTNMPADVVLMNIGYYSETSTVRERLFNFFPLSIRKKIELFLGLNSDLKDLRILMQTPELKNKVFNLGNIPFSEVLKTLSIADLFIMPNIRVEGDAEGFGLVALEATMCETPVLASKIEGITEAIHEGKNGWLIKSRDTEEWIFTLYKLLSEPNKLKTFGVEAKRYTLQNFGWKLMVSEYYNVFCKIIKDHRSENIRHLQEHKNYGVTSSPFHSIS